MTDATGLGARAACVAQVLVEDIENPQLWPDDLHHLSRVLRVRPGENVSVIDNKGHWTVATWQSDHLQPGPVSYEETALPPISIGITVVKGDRPEWAVQKLVEIGVDEILITTGAEHSVVRWDEAKVAKNMARMERIAHDAAMQSRRVRLASLKWVPVIPAGAALTQAGGSELQLGQGTVFVGPEGGWSTSELGASGAQFALGPTILRAETAAVVLASQLATLRHYG